MPPTAQPGWQRERGRNLQIALSPTLASRFSHFRGRPDVCKIRNPSCTTSNAGRLATCLRATQHSNSLRLLVCRDLAKQKQVLADLQAQIKDAETTTDSSRPSLHSIASQQLERNFGTGVPPTLLTLLLAVHSELKKPTPCIEKAVLAHVAPFVQARQAAAAQRASHSC